MPCLDCNNDNSIHYIHEAQEPFCEQCGNDNVCLEEIDSRCVIYHSDSKEPTKLNRLGMPNGSSAERIFEAIDDLLGIGFNKPIVPLLSQSVLLSVSGPVKHELKADVILSTDANNSLQIKENGLYSAAVNDGRVRVDQSDSLAYLEEQIVGSTDGIVSVSVVKKDGQLIAQPSLNIEALLIAIRDSPVYTNLVCQIIAGCTCEPPSNVTATMV